MKNKIAKKLILYFLISLTIFSVIIGGVFSFLFKKHSVGIHKSDLEMRAIQISNTLSEYWNEFGEYGHKKGSGYGAYMKFLGDIAMSDFWVIDKDKQILTYGIRNNDISNNTLPSGAEIGIEEAFKGNIYFSEDFTNLFGRKSIIVANPIKNRNKVIGVVLLYSPIDGIDLAVKEGIKTLFISIITALIISWTIAIILSFKFTKPLKKIKDTAKSLSNGNYKVKTEVNQDDEIGDLAKTIDLLSDRLYDASKESERLEKMRRDFVSNISHELRTPVTVIRGSLEAICDGVIYKDEEIKEYNNQMLLETIHLQRLVNDLLDLSRLQNIDFKMDMVVLNFGDIIEDVIRGMNRLAKSKNIKIIRNYNEANFKIVGDYNRLRQMIIIILDNAIKFSEKDSSIYVEIKDYDKYFSLSIINKGIGIKEEEIPYIFDRFHKTRIEENKSGTGLGLSIAKQIADRHNIKIEVYSEINSITEFKFIINKSVIIN
ncbi:sensor histidine kinase [Eubacterium multiforme]|uniref:histidine kinase n=1 Tax=Eubacterium multiforme TaxID=83339 RepID=A0ABT9UQT4_9FIRM|nr:HAMP domain-containing sensor histidine kinase [Eubacterium multiforme]MDQ0148998.1 signal transduction histidine kinase [Eubacterium multiforme]